MEDISEMDEDSTDGSRPYMTGRVLIEWNGMWPQDQLQLPDTWELFQQITIIDGSTFELYLSNMKPLLALLVKRSELVIMNRCDEVSDENITRYRRGLKALNPQAELIFEDAEGEIGAGGSGRGSSVRHEGRCDQDRSEGLRHLVHRRHG